MAVTIDYRIQTEEYQIHVAWLQGGKREIPGLRWADVLQVLVENLGLPTKFHTTDFLTRMVFPVLAGDQGANGIAELAAVFCSQGRRSGEVLLSIPATVEGASDLMYRLGCAIESRRGVIYRDAIASGIPAGYYDFDAGDEDDDDEDYA